MIDLIKTVLFYSRDFIAWIINMKVIQTFQRNQIRFASHSDLKTLCVHENKSLRKIFDDTKVVMRSRKSMYRQYNGQKKKDKQTNVTMI